jgi:hypothetical protein
MAGDPSRCRRSAPALPHLQFVRRPFRDGPLDVNSLSCPQANFPEGSVHLNEPRREPRRGGAGQGLRSPAAALLGAQPTGGHPHSPPSRRRSHASVRSRRQGRCIMRSGRRSTSQSRCAWSLPGGKVTGSTAASSAPRPGDGTSIGRALPARPRACALRCQPIMPPWPPCRSGTRRRPSRSAAARPRASSPAPPWRA